MGKRSIHQYRPKGEPGAMPYSPQRDLANIYTPMLREVFHGLDMKNWSTHFAELFSKYGVSEEDLGKGVAVFVEAHRSFIRDRDVHSPTDAFEQAGVLDLPAAVRIALFSRIGEVVMAGFFIAIRDTTMQGQASPVHDDLAAMIGAGRAMARALSGHEPSELGDERLCTALAEAEETGRIIAQVQEALLAEKRRVTAFQEEAFQYQSELESVKRQLIESLGISDAVHATQKSGFVRRFVNVVHLSWLLMWKKL